MVVKREEEEEVNEEGVAEKDEGRETKRTKGKTRGRSRKRRKTRRGKGSQGRGEKVVNEVVINCRNFCGGAMKKQSETLNCVESPGSGTLFKNHNKRTKKTILSSSMFVFCLSFICLSLSTRSSL